MTPDTIYCGDAIRMMREWPAGAVDLIFADPPFNIGYVYDGYRDDLPDHQYVAWSRAWMAACCRVLKRDGSFYIAIGDEFAADIRIIGRELGLHLRNWIVWHYSFGQSQRKKFCRSHTHIFYFVKDPQRFTFNDRLLRFPSARHTEYQDLRASPLGRLPDDTWDEFPRVCGTFAERAGFHGCQMPEALLMRIILASSRPGEIVLDPFVGSGTTAVAAKRLGRRYIGIDISPAYVRHARQRLAEAADQHAQPADSDTWPRLHVDMLLQLYRETKVALPNLLPNEVAMRVLTACLSERTGTRYEVEEVRRKLALLAGTPSFPKLPNDRPFVPRNHVRSSGKRYLRKVLRWRPRRSKRTAGDASAAEAI